MESALSRTIRNERDAVGPICRFPPVDDGFEAAALSGGNRLLGRGKARGRPSSPLKKIWTWVHVFR
jgi:hypothetical protein